MYIIYLTLYSLSLFCLILPLSLSLSLSVQFVHDFLNQYHIPKAVRINDATWSEFFNIVLDR